MLLESFAKAFRDLLLPGIIKLFLLCLVAYAIGWFALAGGLGWLIAYFTTGTQLTGIAAWVIGTLGSTVLAWFLFPLFYPLLISFFDDAMADTIERSDYPQLMRASPPFWPTIWHDVVFTLKALLLNIVILPLFIIPPLHFIVYYVMNGYLLGAQFFRMAAGRRMGKPNADALVKRYRGKIALGGLAIMICATIPFLNLIAPVLGVATMLHLFHAVNGNNRVEIL